MGRMECAGRAKGHLSAENEPRANAWKAFMLPLHHWCSANTPHAHAAVPAAVPLPLVILHILCHLPIITPFQPYPLLIPTIHHLHPTFHRILTPYLSILL